MLLHDRELLEALITSKKVSKRKVAQAAGWKSHTYLLRLLNGDVSSLELDPAHRIADFLGVPTNLLFTTKVGTNVVQPAHQNGKRRAS